MEIIKVSRALHGVQANWVDIKSSCDAFCITLSVVTGKILSFYDPKTP
jgi:hypothetical protein